MGIIFMDSFSYYATASITQKWDVSAGYGGAASPSIAGGYGRYGPGLYLPADSQYQNVSRVAKALPIGPSGVVGWAWKCAGSPAAYTSYALMTLNEGTTEHLAVRVLTTTPLILGVYRGSTLLTASPVPVAVSAWVYLELKFTIGASGSYELRQQGITGTSGSGVNTKNGGAGVADQVLFKGQNNQATYICDVIVQSGGDFLGDVRVEYLAPTGVGNKTQFAPMGLGNWQNVDETTPSDADYNSSNTPGAIDTFTMADLSANGVVKGVGTVLRVKKDDAGFRKFRSVLYKAHGIGTDGEDDTARSYLGANKAVTDSPVYDFLYFDTSPDTGAAWGYDEVNALEFGYAVGDAGAFSLDAKLV